MKQPADSSSGGADTGPLLPPMIEGLEVEGDGEPPPTPPFDMRFEDIMPEGMAAARSHLSLQAPEPFEPGTSVLSNYCAIPMLADHPPPPLIWDRDSLPLMPSWPTQQPSGLSVPPQRIPTFPVALGLAGSGGGRASGQTPPPEAAAAAAASASPKSPRAKKKRQAKDEEGGASSSIVMAEDSTGTPWPARVATPAERRAFLEGHVRKCRSVWGVCVCATFYLTDLSTYMHPQGLVVVFFFNDKGQLHEYATVQRAWRVTPEMLLALHAVSADPFGKAIAASASSSSSMASDKEASEEVNRYGIQPNSMGSTNMACSQTRSACSFPINSPHAGRRRPPHRLAVPHAVPLARWQPPPQPRPLPAGHAGRRAPAPAAHGDVPLRAGPGAGPAPHPAQTQAPRARGCPFGQQSPGAVVFH